MNKIRKWIAKDKFLIVRGSVHMAVLVVLCALLFAYMFSVFSVTTLETHLTDETSRFAAQYEQIVRGWFRSLDSTAKLVREDPDQAALYLQVLSDSNPYGAVGMLSNGEIRYIDGTVTPLQYKMAYLYSEGSVPRGRFIAQSDGSILLCTTIDDSRELTVRYDAEDIAGVLRNHFDENLNFAIYNASTGVYLVNCTPFSEGGYYDALLSLNEDGSAAGLLNDESTIARANADGKTIYISQQRTAVRPWNIALVISDARLAGYGAQFAWMPYAITAAAIIILIVIALFLILALRRIRATTQSVESVSDDYAHLIRDLSWEAGVTLFIYRRGREDLLDCYDGLEMLSERNPGRQRVSLRALEEACGLRYEDSERLHESLREIARNSTVELVLRGALPDREEHKLRFVLDAHSSDESVVVCTVSDCTQEMLTQNRAETEQSYLTANMPRTAAVWELNVSRNLWRCIYMKDPNAMGALGSISKSGWRDFTADLDGVLRSYIHPADYGDHSYKMNISSIAGFYRSGRTEINLDYRVRTRGQDDYEWHRMYVRLYSEPETEDILANVYVFNVDVEKNAELERGERRKIEMKTLRALSGIYYALYYVDLDNDLCYAAKSHDGEVVTRLCTPFHETFSQYLGDIHPDDREDLQNMFNLFNIRRMFVEGSRFQRKEYRRRSGDGYRWAAVIIQPARYENGRIKDVVIALRNLVGSRPDLDLE